MFSTFIKVISNMSPTIKGFTEETTNTNQGHGDSARNDVIIFFF